MLRFVAFPMLFIFLFSMACMGQTFQYSRGWTNGKRAAAATALNNLLYRDNGGLAELLQAPEANSRKLEKCLLYLQHFITNPLLLHTTAGTDFALNRSKATTSQYGNSKVSGNRNNSNNRSNNNINNNNPYDRNHQSSEFFEELGSGAIIDTNDYTKQ